LRKEPPPPATEPQCQRILHRVSGSNWKAGLPLAWVQSGFVEKKPPPPILQEPGKEPQVSRMSSRVSGLLLSVRGGRNAAFRAKTPPAVLKTVGDTPLCRSRLRCKASSTRCGVQPRGVSPNCRRCWHYNATGSLCRTVAWHFLSPVYIEGTSTTSTWLASEAAATRATATDNQSSPLFSLLGVRS
jgi:hypothetical protein